MNYVLQDLLRVRQHRQNDAEAALAHRRDVEAKARQVLADRKRERVEYIAWRIAEEKRLWDDLLRRKLTNTPELDDLKATCSFLREQELAYDKAITAAEAEVLAAAKETLAAQEAARIAAKGTQKIEEHKEIWVRDERRAEEASAEKETEDHRTHTINQLLEADETEESTS